MNSPNTYGGPTSDHKVVLAFGAEIIVFSGRWIVSVQGPGFFLAVMHLHFEVSFKLEMEFYIIFKYIGPNELMLYC